VAAASMGGVPGMPQVPDAAAYTPLGQDVLREVQQFINQGGGAASALASPQASWLALQAARQAAQRLGVSPRSVMAHAALESGWGQRPEPEAFLARRPWTQQPRLATAGRRAAPADPAASCAQNGT